MTRRHFFGRTVTAIGTAALEQCRAINSAAPSPTGTQVSRVNFPELAVIYLVDAVGKSDYHALAAKLQRRFSGGLTYLASYSLGYLLRASECRCRCRSTSTRYWQLSSILTLQTGFPLNIVDGKNQTNDFITSIDRPNATGQILAIPRGQQDPQRFFNTGAVVLQPFGTFGNLGRNVLMGPGIINLDFSATKSIPILESQRLESRRLEFRFEAFNSVNHPNWGTPDVTVLDAAFGKVTSKRTPMRQLQGSLKFYF